jgi:ATP-dependent Clp protease adapter protein ClpS
VGSDLIDQGIPDSEAFALRFLDDEETPMDFVVHVLVSQLHLNREAAALFMMQIHRHGFVDIGRMPTEVAQRYHSGILSLVAQQGFPLRCDLVPFAEGAVTPNEHSEVESV